MNLYSIKKRIKGMLPSFVLGPFLMFYRLFYFFIFKPLIFLKRAIIFFLYYGFNGIILALCSEIESPLYVCKRNTFFPHPIGIVLGKGTKLGKRCEILQNVTLGRKYSSGKSSPVYPSLGNNVKIGANSIILGDVKIGDNVVIGAGSVVLSDVPSDSVIVGNPARIIKNLKE